MQMILLLLIPLLSFAQEKCDPVQAERDCYNLICKTSPVKAIPLEANDLAVAFKAYPYDFPDSFKKELESLGKLSEEIRTYSRKKLNDNDLGRFTSEIMNDPVGFFPYMKAFFGNELKCVQRNFACDLIVNDLSAYPEGMKTFYKTLYNKSLVLAEPTSLTMDQKKDLLQLAVGKDKAEKKKIKKLKTEADFFIYMLNASWIGEYKKKLADELKVYTQDVQAALKIRSEDFLKIELVSEGRLAYVKRTCQLGAFIQDTIEANGTVAKFAENRDRVVESFRKKFLPQLSLETAKELGAAITPDTFVLIDTKTSIYPPKFTSIHENGYSEPKGAAQFMNDLVLLDRGEAVKCNSGGKLVSDHFNSATNKIFISKYVLANSFPDIFTHEMGHWLSGQMAKGKLSSRSKKKLMKVRKCISSFYDEKKESKYAVKFKGDKFRTEEDFADWFAAKAGIGESGVFCDLKKMVRSEDVDNYLPDPVDSHSNYLFRDLVIRLNRGEVLPQRCKDLIDVSPASQPKKCDL